ncbi:MAG: SAM-dependent methyltransferase [Flavobacteriaceae bacterium]|nr:SAM-dependent methyltransferase [Flavobacteriaceae bacterium]MDG1031805.1 SAM-dependent methyltransferase [Flavobacteriaceae bacterium]MDG1344198.1 SAM-dependent methyltransferase [Flavobacteriaceae bacterium]
MSLGKLYLVPNKLGESKTYNFPIYQSTLINNIKYFIFENEKPGRAFIKNINPKKNQSELNISILNKYSTEKDINSFLNPCLNGNDIALISDAGCPGIADPGSEIVRLAHENEIKVIPLVGPSSILLALMGSGMNGQNFKFNGYLPIEKNERKKKIKILENKSLVTTQIFMETPYRNNKFFSTLLSTLKPETKLCVACDLTLITEYIKTKKVKHWKSTKVDIHKRPTIFLIQSN